MQIPSSQAILLAFSLLSGEALAAPFHIHGDIVPALVRRDAEPVPIKNIDKHLGRASQVASIASGASMAVNAIHQLRRRDAEPSVLKGIKNVDKHLERASRVADVASTVSSMRQQRRSAEAGPEPDADADAFSNYLLVREASPEPFADAEPEPLLGGLLRGAVHAGKGLAHAMSGSNSGNS